MSGARLDLVIPVHDALRSTRCCLESVRSNAPAWARVVVVNDGSDERTTEWLRQRDGILLLENPVRLGPVKTANRGLSLSDAPYVCLLGSDTLLTAGALERMVARMDADPSIGLCCPLSSSTADFGVRLPPGEDAFRFADRVARTSPARYPDAVAVAGFCLLVRREVVRTLGLLDEAFGTGCGQEADVTAVRDYHYRARAAGWRCVVADDTFVYHRQGVGHPGSGERERRSLELLARRWRGVPERELAEIDRRDELGAVRDAATHEWILPDPSPKPLDVLFVLPVMGVFGGVADVLELANALLLEGVSAGVAVLAEEPHEMDLELFFRPVRLSPDRFLEDLPEARLLVATAYQTVAPVAAAAARRGIQSAYFVQDYEGWFGTDGPEYVAKTYELVPRLTAISTWLAGEIEKRHGFTATVVPMSADPEQFYPRGDRRADGPVRVVAMLRPDERRGLHHLLPALARVARRSDVEVVLFGSHRVPRDAEPFAHRHAGILSREGVARLLSTAHVVVDPSLFQGFGLVGLEGMASGAACVLTDSGGIREYAVDGENALVVPPRDAAALADGILRLVEDRALRERLARAGVETARRFTWQRAARLYADFVRSLPPPTPPTPREKAALELLWEEARKPHVPGDAGARPETTLTVSRSGTWRLLSPWRRLKARLRPSNP